MIICGRKNFSIIGNEMVIFLKIRRFLCISDGISDDFLKDRGFLCKIDGMVIF